VASLLVLPWLIYCQRVFGQPIPQSGVATSAALHGPVAWDTLLETLSLSIAPHTIKVRTMVGAHRNAAAVLLFLATLAVAAAWRPYGRRWMDSASHWVLVSLATACCLLVLYYSIFSSAHQFFERYFAPIKLLVLIVLALLLARLVARLRPRAASAIAVCAAAALFVGSNLYWTWRDFDLPFRGYIGETAYAIVRSPYASNGARLGLAESGRIGFLYPDRVVNLDGKMRVDALHALRDGSFARFVHATELDFIVLHGFDVRFFNKVAPGWNDGYVQVEDLGNFSVFAKR